MSSTEAVEVWTADLDQVPDEPLALLSAPEREHAAQIRDERGRRRWSASRAVLRDLLSRWTRADPAQLELELGAEGKPRLRCSPGRAVGFAWRRVRFNLSHSGPLALYALCASREVGVDVELAADAGAGGGRELAIARRMLGEQVAARLQALAPEELREEFLRAWVAHEAAVKCLGVGLRGAREGVRSDWAKVDWLQARWAEVDRPEVGWPEVGRPAVEAPERPSDATAAPVPASVLTGIWVTPIDLSPRAFGALAVQGGPAEVRRRVWEP
jgi:phosphopantetheinyl transferase